jgi:hypothetical protein
MKLLSGEFKPGDAIKVTAAAGNLKFQPQKPPPAKEEPAR